MTNNLSVVAITPFVNIPFDSGCQMSLLERFLLVQLYLKSPWICVQFSYPTLKTNEKVHLKLRKPFEPCLPRILSQTRGERMKMTKCANALKTYELPMQHIR